MFHFAPPSLVKPTFISQLSRQAEESNKPCTNTVCVARSRTIASATGLIDDIVQICMLYNHHVRELSSIEMQHILRVELRAIDEPRRGELHTIDEPRLNSSWVIKDRISEVFEGEKIREPFKSKVTQELLSLKKRQTRERVVLQYIAKKIANNTKSNLKIMTNRRLKMPGSLLEDFIIVEKIVDAKILEKVISHFSVDRLLPFVDTLMSNYHSSHEALESVQSRPPSAPLAPSTEITLSSGIERLSLNHHPSES
ncbi:MAG: hypothetical protein JWO53_667 [Chlamydiia bacterium]|nr:hypothetical protein [Chlamydiia bacterium]